MNWLALIFLVLLPGVWAADDAAQAIALGRSARADGVPQAAIHDLQRAAAAVKGPGGVDVLVELARCLIESDREAEAVGWLEIGTYRKEPSVIFWRAQARAQQRDFPGALADYNLACEADSPLRVDAELGRARMLEALGRSQEALMAYQKIPSGSSRYRAAQLAAAALLIKANRSREAGDALEELKTGKGAEKELRRYLVARVALDGDGRESPYEDFKARDPRLMAGAAIGQADAMLRAGNEDRAEESLESFVSANPNTPLLENVLAKLDEVRARQSDPSNSTLKQWAADDDQQALSAAATFYLGRNYERQGRADLAIRSYGKFLDQYPANPLRTAAIIRLASLLIGARQIDEAMKILPPGDAAPDRADQARLRFLRATAQYLSGDFPAAAKTFISAAGLDPKISDAALANAAMTAITMEDRALAAEILNALRNQNATVARRIELAQAFHAARNGEADAAGQMARIAARGGSIGDRARLALAESKWMSGDAAGAQAEFRRVANSTAAGRGSQKDYFEVYLADDGSAKAAEAVADAASRFLKDNPDSPRESDVRMKWGEVLMREGDDRGARVQFEEAARSSGDPALKQSASFFAARAAIASMNIAELESAVLLLEDVAQAKQEPLASQARFEQALLQAALGRPKDSVTILDSLIASAAEPRLRFTARLKKGEVLDASAGGDKSQLAAAIKEWQAVAADPDATTAERNEALTRAAAANQQAGDADAALAGYYEVLTAPRDQQPEYFWYYKAGFAAAQMLEAQQRWKEAAAIYEKMAAAPGPRANEFKERVKRLRLEKFIWED